MQKESAAEIELNLKKKARRRLVGAIALVILMLAILPFALKDRAAIPSDEDVKITMGNESVTLPTAQSESHVESGFDSSVVPSEEATVSQPVELPASAENSASQAVKSEPKQEPSTNITEASTSENNSSDPEAAPVAQEAKKVEEKPQEKPVELPKAEVEQIKDKKGTFFVQVGVFSDPANVKKLEQKLADLGFQAKTEKVSTPKGEKIRLKTHTFKSRKEAADALEKIKDAGLTGMVVSQ
jgi:DedD protein